MHRDHRSRPRSRPRAAPRWVRRITNPNAKFLFTFLFIVWAVGLRRSALQLVPHVGASSPYGALGLIALFIGLLHHDGPPLGGDRGVAPASRAPLERARAAAPTRGRPRCAQTDRPPRRPQRPALARQEESRVASTRRCPRPVPSSCLAPPAAPSAVLRRLRPVRDAAGLRPGGPDGDGRPRLRLRRGPSRSTAEHQRRTSTAVDAASDRVVTAEAATSVGGQSDPLRDRRPPGPGDARTRLAAIRAEPPGPARPARRRRPRSTPRWPTRRPILWVAGNVHGGEESGADARCTPCTSWPPGPTASSSGILDQRHRRHPADPEPRRPRDRPRRNLYGFDMNRDWFARTQPETDGKLEVIRRVPADAVHRRPRVRAGRTTSSRRTPIPSTTRSRTRPTTGSTSCTARRSSTQFDAEGIKYFHGAPYDFFAIDLRRHRPDRRLPRRRDDLREGERRPDRRARARAVHLDLGVARRPAPTAARRGRRRPGATRTSRRTSRASPASSRPNAVFEPRHKLYQPVPDVDGPPLLPARRPGPRLRAAAARPPPPADGRRGPRS